MPPLLSMLASPSNHDDNPRDEVTEEDVIFKSTLVIAGQDCQQITRITDVKRETSDDN